jgi:dihydrofolate synthase/folylpolyglutamate synthase
MDMLGNTLTKIAFEKGGIIKDSTPIVIGPMHEEAKIELIRQATIRNSILLDASLTEVPESWTEQFSLKGIYQRENLKTIFTIYQYLQPKFNLNLDKSEQGLSRIKENSGLRGRWEVFSDKPYIVADTAHNYPGVEQTMIQLQELGFSGDLHIVWGMVSDKDRNKILSLLPKNAKYYFCKPSVIRGLNAKDLAEDAMHFGLQGLVFDTVSDAILAAKSQLSSEDALYIGGSTFVVADALLELE